MWRSDERPAPERRVGAPRRASARGAGAQPPCRGAAPVLVRKARQGNCAKKGICSAPSSAASRPWRKFLWRGLTRINFQIQAVYIS